MSKGQEMSDSRQGDRLWSNDFLSGFLLIAISCLVATGIRDLEWNSIMGVGPGYFPGVAAIVLFVLGTGLCGSSLVGRQSNVIDLRNGIGPALYVVGSVLLFALMLNSAGLVIAVSVAAFVASAASRGMSLRTRAILAAALAGFAALIFHIALSLPMPLWPGWF